jgi:hypothetical protein
VLLCLWSFQHNFWGTGVQRHFREGIRDFRKGVRDRVIHGIREGIGDKDVRNGTVVGTVAGATGRYWK